jgi:P-type Mg2+ transporter
MKRVAISQILLSNLLYDASEITIPTDNVDPELLHRPARWDMKLIRAFMTLFGPINACFDFFIFAVLIWVLHAGPALFGFATPPLGFFVPLIAIVVVAYFTLVEVAKLFFYRSVARRTATDI